MKYRVIYGDAMHLEENVQWYLDRGWEPVGGPTKSLSDNYLIQAIVYKEGKTNE